MVRVARSLSGARYHRRMPPRRFSRYTFSSAQADASGALVLHGGDPFRYRELPDNRWHPVVEGDTLFTLAARYFRGLDRPAGLYWVIMDFQPDPIHDPTLSLVPGTQLVIPSKRTVLEDIFGEKRRREEGW